MLYSSQSSRKLSCKQTTQQQNKQTKHNNGNTTHSRTPSCQNATAYSPAHPVPESHPSTDSLRGSSVKIGTIQRILAWPLRKDDTHTHTSISVK